MVNKDYQSDVLFVSQLQDIVSSKT